MEKTNQESKLESFKEDTILTVNQILDLISDNFDAVEIMGSLRLNEIVEKLRDFKINNSMGGNMKVENTKDFVKELKKIKKSY